MIQVSKTVRIEQGPARKTAVATKAILDDAITARHYTVGRYDALGKIIKLGAEMTYLDWKSDPGWYVYKLVAGRYVPQGFHAEKADALQQANTL